MPESATTTSLDIFVARQPIFDDKDRVAGYELLSRRSGDATRADGLSALQMSSEVLVQAVIGIGMERITGGAPAPRDAVEARDPGRPGQCHPIDEPPPGHQRQRP
ncbi:MAG: hypothetical protein ABJD07_07260 [Gemmatimonadaceae bacterium]